MGPLMSESFELTCKKVLNELGLIERLKEAKYDVYITENFDVCGPGKVIMSGNISWLSLFQP